jgi:Flavin containing amine oxidoreductase
MKIDTLFVYLASLVGCLLLLVDIVFGSCMNVVDDYDVVIVGGGMSGISAAAQLIAESDLSVVVLESTQRLGGRVKSKKDFGKGGPDGETDGWTIEEGANWQFSYEGNEVFALLQEYDMKYTHTNFMDFNKSSYQYHDYLPVRTFVRLRHWCHVDVCSGANFTSHVYFLFGLHS